MREKIIKVALVLLLSALWAFSAEWCILYQNLGLLGINAVLTALLFYYIPVIAFSREYRLPVYVWEIIIGFVVFLLVFLDDVERGGLSSAIRWNGLLMVDSIIMISIGFYFAQKGCDEPNKTKN